MSLLPLLLGITIVSQGYKADGCLPRRGKELTDSFVPVCIQALNHYKSQLQVYYPHTFTGLCKIGKHTMVVPEFPPDADFCVAETVARINLFLTDLQREAAEQNLEDSQGLANSVLIDVQKTSQMTAAQQLHYILYKLQKEEIGNGAIVCKSIEFMQDLEDPNSKLFKNFLTVKRLNYLNF